MVNNVLIFFVLLCNFANAKCHKHQLPMSARLVETPIYTEAVLLSLHAASALAAVQGAGEQGGHSVGTLTPGPGTQLHTAVASHTLPQGSETWAAGFITGA